MVKSRRARGGKSRTTPHNWADRSEVEDHGVRHVLRKNETEARRERHPLEGRRDKQAKLEEKIAAGWQRGDREHVLPQLD
jgi:hypothetical protein